MQTGRLQFVPKCCQMQTELRPNLMVNVELQAGFKTSAIRVSSEAIQQVDNKDVVFVAQTNQKKGLISKRFLFRSVRKEPRWTMGRNYSGSQ